MHTAITSTVDLAHTCRRLLNDLRSRHLQEPTLLGSASMAFELDSIEAARHQLARTAKDADSTEQPDVCERFRELHAAMSAFNDQVGPLLHMEDRSQRFAEFKAWMADPMNGELPQQPLE